jgi:sterol 24-C-methyltransferase
MEPLVTDFFEYGWGRFLPFRPTGSRREFQSIAGTPRAFFGARTATKTRNGWWLIQDVASEGHSWKLPVFSGAKIVGVNSNAYQLERARQLVEEAELAHLAEFLHCDFLAVDAPDNSFDAVYSIEATCCAPDKISIYSEAFRLLKPGSCFDAYEYCMTDRFDPQDPHRLRIKADIQLGGGLVIIDDMETVDNALRSVGFEVIQTRDLSLQKGPSIPWYEPLVGSGLSESWLPGLPAPATKTGGPGASRIHTCGPGLLPEEGLLR